MHKKSRVESWQLSGKTRRQRARRAGLSTLNSQLSSSPAFTLVELLIVMAIIGVVVALGVPLFGVLTGARSQEAGQNLVAAAIGQARTIALSEGKYAGVLFYVDPATERTAMTVVVAGAGLEDPDPYDKYKTFVGGQVYRASAIATDGTVVAGERAITIASDASATFRNGPATPTNRDVYDATSLVYSNLSKYFGNFKPVVLSYRAIMDPSPAGSATFGAVPDAPGSRPPRHGPFGTRETRHRRVEPDANDTFSISEPTGGTFQNDNWSVDQLSVVSPLDGAERQLLPLGVGVQAIISPVAVAGSTVPERYVRVALVMFDPQGKLSLEPRTVPAASVLGTQLGLTDDVPAVQAGVGVVFYDRAAFRQSPTRSEADALHQLNATTPTNTLAVAAGSIYADFSSTANEATEETWLDTNTVPLLINRYSGALGEAQ